LDCPTTAPEDVNERGTDPYGDKSTPDLKGGAR
jgi:hypothetical protein